MNLNNSEFEILKKIFKNKHTNKNLELEAIILAKNIDKKKFEKILHHFKSNFEIIDNMEVLDISIKGSKDDDINNIRATIKGINNIQNYCKTNKLLLYQPTYLLKDRFKDKDIPLNINRYNLRFNLKKETIPKDTDKDKFNKLVDNSVKYFRLKKRFSFIKNNYRFDFTIVKSSDNFKKYDNKSLLNSGLMLSQPHYEIEIEYINNNRNSKTDSDNSDSDEDETNEYYPNDSELISELFNNITRILQILNESEFIIDNLESSKIYQKFVNLVGKDWIGPQPVTLELQNLNKDDEGIKINKNEEEAAIYSVTDKADGKRTLLFIDNTYKLYFITRADKNLKVTFSGYKLVNEENSNIILDGELTNSIDNLGNVDKNKFLYLIFDIYYINDEDIRCEILYEKDSELCRYKRMKNLTTLKNSLNYLNIEKINDTQQSNLNLEVYLKPFQFTSDLTKGKDKKIFTCSKNILNMNRNYAIDGLIYTPENFAVANNKPGILDEPLSYTGKTWEYVFKWKPPEQNSIDFSVVYESIENLNGEYYRIISLRVGMSEKDYIDMNLCKKMFDDKESLKKIIKNKYILIEFNPVNTTNVNKAKIKLIDGKIYTEDGKEILNNSVVEFSFNKDTNSWYPIRLRDDKVFGNNYKTAYSVWNSIQNPITEEMIKTGKDINKKTIKEQKYYADSTKHLKKMRNFHNWIIKKKLISSVSQENNHLLDLAVGRGGDLSKWVDNKLDLVIGIDIGREGLENPEDGACKRYQKLLMQNKKNLPETYFICGDCSKNIENGDAGIDDLNSNHLKILWGSDNSFEEHKLFGIAKNKFDVISCQFAIHYFLENKKKFHQFVKNVSDNLKIGGYFICTTLDGNKIYSLLKGIEKGESIQGLNSEGEEMWSIKKEYDNDIWETAEVNNKFGIPIKPDLKTINPVTEYLVDSGTIYETMNEFGLELSKPNKTNEIKNSDASFNKLTKFIKKGDELDDYEEEYSFLNKWFIFRKKELSDNVQFTLKKK